MKFQNKKVKYAWGYQTEDAYDFDKAKCNYKVNNALSQLF